VSEGAVIGTLEEKEICLVVEYAWEDLDRHDAGNRNVHTGCLSK